MSGEKTEKPTAQRLKKARKEGQTPKTAEMGAWAGVLAVSMIMPWSMAHFIDGLQQLMVQGAAGITHASVDSLAPLAITAMKVFATVFLPLGLGILLVGVSSSAAQGGVHFATKAIKPSMKKLDPVQGLKRMFGTQGMWESAKALLKTTALVIALWKATTATRLLLSASGALPLTTILDAAGGSALMMLRVAGITGMVLAVADYVVVRKKTMKKLKMSVSDIKMEAKQQEGDPLLKQAIRSKQMAMSRNRMMSDVTHADVVLVNPVHVAVALKYDPMRGSPRVIAKGSGEIAAKLREIAAEARVPIVQDIPLARALNASCDIGQEVPAQLFTAVARVLAFVMHLQSKGGAAGFHRPHFPPPPIEGLPRAGRRR
ncbi:EscU/YscU/HrcU family type III secretion system export apparatus switch protein [Tessaracoccus sp.]